MENKTKQIGGENNAQGLDCFSSLVGLLFSKQEFPFTALKNRHVSRLFVSHASRLRGLFLSAEGTCCMVGEPAGWEPFPERFPPARSLVSRLADPELIFASPHSFLLPHFFLIRGSSTQERHPLRVSPEGPWPGSIGKKA